MCTFHATPLSVLVWSFDIHLYLSFLLLLRVCNHINYMLLLRVCNMGNMGNMGNMAFRDYSGVKLLVTTRVAVESAPGRAFRDYSGVNLLVTTAIAVE